MPRSFNFSLHFGHTLGFYGCVSQLKTFSKIHLNLSSRNATENGKNDNERGLWKQQNDDVDNFSDDVNMWHYFSLSTQSQHFLLHFGLSTPILCRKYAGKRLSRHRIYIQIKHIIIETTSAKLSITNGKQPTFIDIYRHINYGNVLLLPVPSTRRAW